jgi:Na+/melibiose symporter-like transporter
MAEGVKTRVFNTFVLFYYNQIIGISATLTALALGIAALFDALSDPVAGYLSDRTRSRWGRRHP